MAENMSKCNLHDHNVMWSESQCVYGFMVRKLKDRKKNSNVTSSDSIAIATDVSASNYRRELFPIATVLRYRHFSVLTAIPQHFYCYRDN